MFGRALGKVLGRSHSVFHSNPMWLVPDTIGCDINLQMELLRSAGDGRGNSLWTPQTGLVNTNCPPAQIHGILFLCMYLPQRGRCDFEICRVSNITGLPWETIAESK